MRTPGPFTAVASLLCGSASGGLVALGAALVADWVGDGPVTAVVPWAFVVGWVVSTWAFARRAPTFWTVFARAGVTGAVEWALVSLLGVVVPVADATARTAGAAEPPVAWMFAHALLPLIRGLGPLVVALVSLCVGIVAALAARAWTLRD